MEQQKSKHVGDKYMYLIYLVRLVGMKRSDWTYFISINVAANCTRGV
jgi:hypothetical protein